MTKITIALLDHRAPGVAASIHAVMIAAYRVEAELLDCADFVPLRRTRAKIAGALSRFHGARIGDDRNDGVLAGTIEIEPASGLTPTNIASLVVLPSHFRRGIGRALVRHAIGLHGDAPITVSTGVANAPALALYEGLGFTAARRWTTPDGIAMVTLVRE